MPMPTILRIGPYRFFFYNNEDGEPVHIHIQRDNKLAKFWVNPVVLASSTDVLKQQQPTEEYSSLTSFCLFLPVFGVSDCR